MVLKTIHLVTGAVLLGVGAGGLMSYIAAQHNPQGEFIASGGEVSVLFGRVFLLYSVFVFICTFFIGFLIKGVLDENKKQRKRD